MFAVPVCELLEGAAGLKDCCVVTGTRNELHADGELLVGETAGDGESGKSAEITDGANWVGKREALRNVHGKWSCGYG